MENIKKPLQQLTKQEFNESYEEMLKVHEDNLEFRPLPTKEEVLQFAVNTKQITMNKYIEFIG